MAAVEPAIVPRTSAAQQHRSPFRCPPPGPARPGMAAAAKTLGKNINFIITIKYLDWLIKFGFPKPIKPLSERERVTKVVSPGTGESSGDS